MDLCRVCAMKYSVESASTRLYFSDGQYIEINASVCSILEKMCLLQGSNMQGRMDSFKCIMQVKRKIPVLVSLYKECVFFPVKGYMVEECVWIQYKYIKRVTSLETSECIVHFDGGFQMRLDVGGRVIYKQMKRCRGFIDRIKSSVYSGEIFVDELCYTNSGDVNE